MQVPERVLGVVKLQIHSIVVLLKVKLSAVAVVAILDSNHGLAEVRQIEKQTLLDLFELAAFDLVIVRLIIIPETEEIMAPTEFRG